MVEQNWAGNYEFGADRIHRPVSLDGLCAVVSAADHVKALGSRHSFTGVGDSADLVSLDAMPREIVVASDRSSVSVSAQTTYTELAAVLVEHRLALHNLASLPHITIGGTVTTGTHGSGDQNGNLATAVAGIEIVTANGEVHSFVRGDDRFEGVVVSMGMLGVSIGLTLDVEPEFEMNQTVYEPVGFDWYVEHLDDVHAAGYSVSAFTRWADGIEQIWMKARVGEEGDASTRILDELVAVTEQRHPILGLSGESCTQQLGRPGRWSDRLPHFRGDSTPSVGNEIQSEFFVDRAFATAAVDAMRRIGHEISDLLLVGEIRTIAADDLWMSPHHGSDSLGFHFTWRREPARVVESVAIVEQALAPFSPRPHWGKVFTPSSFDIPALYERADDFAALRRDLDPHGTFANDWSNALLDR